MKISKELFFAVKNFKEFDFDYVYDVKNEKMKKGIECFYFICKEWAIENLFAYMNIGTISETRATLDLRVKFNFGIWRGYSCSVVTLDERHTCLYTAKYYETEVESVVKACQWILDNKKDRI